MTLEEFATVVEDLAADYNFNLKKAQDREEFTRDLFLELQSRGVDSLEEIDEESEDSEEESDFEEDDL